ncbi:MAG TPA: endo alpha-1,4 polygalactosaminidase [Solirubrobacteraceae bacterium]|nr:endo alpha-1,4 polygalactosaminidase [Solirubrobacteraceae bacterium]
MLERAYRWARGTSRLPRRLWLRLALVLVVVSGPVAFAVIGGEQPSTAAAAGPGYSLPPVGADQWYWQIGGGNLPSMTGAYPAPGSANIWDTDGFADASAMGSNNEPSGPSTVVTQLHATGKYSICYIEAGAQQAEPDQSHFAAADYGNAAKKYAMQGWPGEYWYDTLGFAGWSASSPNAFLGGSANDQSIAADIAAGMAQRIAGCAAEGQDAIEPDDLDGYTNPGATGVAGGGWHLTQAAAQGYEAWLAYTAHADGLAAFQKNDGANSAAEVGNFDGLIIEECNYYKDPCAGSGGDATPYLNAGKPVLNAEYSDDRETTAKFCSADTAAGITGALFNVNLDGKTYQPCAPASTSTSTTTSSSSSTTTSTTTSLQRPFNMALPVVSGTARQGQQLQTTNGTWIGSPSRYTYAWQRCRSGSCTVVRNATSRSYSLGSSDVGYQLESIVAAANSAGSTSAISNPSATVASRH